MRGKHSGWDLTRVGGNSVRTQVLTPCALVHNFHLTFTDPDPDNSMWVVEPTYGENGSRFMSVVHVDPIIHAAHLLPVFQGLSTLPPQLTFSKTLDSFCAFYINKYINYHAFETMF